VVVVAAVVTAAAAGNTAEVGGAGSRSLRYGGDPA